MEKKGAFEHWLKQRRKELDLTQFDLVARLGCSEDTLQKIEAGARRPSRQIAQLLAECLEIPPEERPAFVRLARATGEHTLVGNANDGESGIDVLSSPP